MPRLLRGAFPPADGESFHSWMVRLAASKHATTSDLFDRLGLREWQVSGKGDSVYGVCLSDGDAERLSASTGVTVERIRQTELMTFDQGALDFSEFDPSDPGTVRGVAADQPVFLRTWRVCPDCLAADGVVMLVWHLAGSYACPHHGLLMDDCPSCGLPISLGRDGRLFPASPHTVPQPGHCSNLVPDPAGKLRTRVVCGYDLARAAGSGDIESGESFGRVSIHSTEFNLFIGAGSSHRAFGESIPGRDFLKTIRALASLHAYADTPDDVLVDLPQFVNWAHRRDNGDQAAVVNWSAGARSASVLTVVSVEAGEDIHDLDRNSWESSDRLNDLAERVCARRRRFHHKVDVELTGFGLPERILPLWHAACAKAQPGFVAPTRCLAAARGVWAIGIDDLPGLLPECYYPTFAPFLTGMSRDTGRKFVGLLVAKYVCDGTWDDLGDALGYPEREAGRVAAFGTRIVRETGARDDLWAHVDAHANRIDYSAGPVDLEYSYGARRRRFAGWTDMGTTLWNRIVAYTGIHRGRTDARRRYATVRAWADATGGHPYWAPGLQQQPGGATTESLREGYRRFEKDGEAAFGLLESVWEETDFDSRTAS